MRLMLVGIPEKHAAVLWKAVGDIAANAGTLRDWRLLEKAVEQARPDALAIYLGSRPGQVLALLKRVRALHPGLQAIAMVDDAERSLVQSVAEAGCTDIVVLREGPADLRRAVEGLATRDGPPVVDGEVVAVMGAKGGVGTTVIAANLAAELAVRTRQRVILVDLHLYLGDAAVVLDMPPRPSALWFIHRGSAADAQTWSEAPPLHRSGFRLLGLDGELSEADPVTAEQVVYFAQRLRQRYDFVVIDVGSEVNEVSLAACSVANQRLLVTTTDLAARTGARRRYQALRELGVEGAPARAVINRAQDLDDEALEDLARSIGVPIVGTIANAWHDVQGALERGQVLRQCAPRSPAARDLAVLADLVAGERAGESRRKRTFFNFFR